MSIYNCQVCQFVFNDHDRGMPFEHLPANWTCPECGASKSNFLLVDKAAVQEGRAAAAAAAAAPAVLSPLEASLHRHDRDEVEQWMQDIHTIAATGQSIHASMRCRQPVISWDDILILGKQLNCLPLLNEDRVVTQTIIGPKAKQPLVIDTPILISHMSFGCLSREATIALAKGSAQAGTAVGSGEGGILPESFSASHKYIFEYVPNQYSVTQENLLKVDAIELQFGQSSRPGLGSHLPGHKVTAEVSAIRGFPVGQDIISPSRYPDIHSRAELKAKIDWLREASNGRPIGVKIAAGQVEKDLDFALAGGPDFITLDGRPGGTDFAPKFIQMATSVPTLFALSRARLFLDSNHAAQVSLIVTGGLRVSPDFAKALALGADAVGIGTAALLAMGCQQDRLCQTGNCPLGITAQHPDAQSGLDIEQAAQRLSNFLQVSTQELILFAKLTGHHNIHELNLDDLCTCNSEISNHTNIRHA